MYTQPLTSIGGEGGGPFDHSEHLQQQGYTMGCGSRGMRLTRLHIEEKRALSYVSAAYASWSDAASTCDVPGKGLGRSQSEDQSWDIYIGPNERVTKVAGEYGYYRYPWAYGNQPCLHSITFTIESVDGHTRDVSAGRKDFQDDYYQTPGICNSAAASTKVVQVPPGLTVAGLSGSTGEIWDKIILHACPYLPGQGVWNRALHKHYCWPFKKQVQTLLLCLNRLSKPVADQADQIRQNPAIPWLPPRVKEYLVSALFKETFMAATNIDTAAAAAEEDYISEWVIRQAKKCCKQAEQLLKWLILATDQQ